MIKLKLNKLKAKVVENGKNNYDLAKHLGISRASLHRKLTGKTDITTDEAIKACEYLEIDDLKERQDIFLS